MLCQKQIKIIGYGTQSQAWSHCLRASGWNLKHYLRPNGPSWLKALDEGFQIFPLADLRAHLASDAQEGSSQAVAFLCPDSQIAPLYQEFVSAYGGPLALILAHGYASYSGALSPATAAHEVCLFAPKAIGPKIKSEFDLARLDGIEATRFHPLKAATFASDRSGFESLGAAMGFQSDNLIWVKSPDEEAIADLMSEQGLLCGGVFSLLCWTMRAMADAGVDRRLIREECLTELSLIADILKEHGPQGTYDRISEAAQCGAVKMKQALDQSGAHKFFLEQLHKNIDRSFVDQFENTDWRKDAPAAFEDFSLAHKKRESLA